MNSSSTAYIAGGSSYPSVISIPSEVKSPLIDILNQTLATTLDLKSQVKQAQWSLSGASTYHLYELFEEITTELDECIDLLAERITNIGGLAMGTARIAVKQSILPEYPIQMMESKEHVIFLAERLAIYGTLLWENIDRTSVMGDSDTAYLYAEISLIIDKRLWFFDALIMSSHVDENHQVASRN